MRIVKWLQNNNVDKEEPTNVSSDLQSPVVKSHPPRLRTKGSPLVLKDDEEENDAKMTDPASVVTSSLTEDTKPTDPPTSMKEVLSELVTLFIYFFALSIVVQLWLRLKCSDVTLSCRLQISLIQGKTNHWSCNRMRS